MSSVNVLRIPFRLGQQTSSFDLGEIELIGVVIAHINVGISAKFAHALLIFDQIFGHSKEIMIEVVTLLVCFTQCTVIDLNRLDKSPYLIERLCRVGPGGL